MAKKNGNKTECTEECESPTMIDITVNIGGKEFTMEEAEEIYLKLKELFEMTVVTNPYDVINICYGDE